MEKSGMSKVDKVQKNTRFASSTLIAVGGEELHKVKIIEYYDPDSNRWTKLADVDAKRIYFKSALLGDKLMFTGGILGPSTSMTVQSFDFSTGELTTVAKMKVSRTFHGISVYSNELIVIGGYNGDYINDVESYNPTTNTWKVLTSMPTMRGYCESAIHDINNEIYVMGGFNGDYLSVVEAYNPSQGSWKSCAPMRQARDSFAMASIGNFIYTVGGFNNDIGVMNEIDRYDPFSDTWTSIGSTNMPRFLCAGANFNEAMIVAGGADANGVSNLVESYKDGGWTTLGPLVVPRIFFDLVEVPWQLIDKVLKLKN